MFEVSSSLYVEEGREGWGLGGGGRGRAAVEMDEIEFEITRYSSICVSFVSLPYLLPFFLSPPSVVPPRPCFLFAPFSFSFFVILFYFRFQARAS